MSDNADLSTSVSLLFEQFSESEAAIEVMSLSTADGFPIQSYSRGQHTFESDTLAAAASTLFSVSNAVAHQILSKQYKSTFIEADKGNIFFISLKLGDKDFVLAVCASESVNIASLRLFTNRLASAIISHNL